VVGRRHPPRMRRPGCAPYAIRGRAEPEPFVRTLRPKRIYRGADIGAIVAPSSRRWWTKCSTAPLQGSSTVPCRVPGFRRPACAGAGRGCRGGNDTTMRVGRVQRGRPKPMNPIERVEARFDRWQRRHRVRAVTARSSGVRKRPRRATGARSRLLRVPVRSSRHCSYMSLFSVRAVRRPVRGPTGALGPGRLPPSSAIKLRSSITRCADRGRE